MCACCLRVLVLSQCVHLARPVLFLVCPVEPAHVLGTWAVRMRACGAVPDGMRHIVRVYRSVERFCPVCAFAACALRLERDGGQIDFSGS